MSSTKGASNHYGNSNGSRKGHATSHISYEWARGFNKNSLDEHAKKHGDNVSADNKKSYEAKAVHFANKVDRKNHESFVDKKGTTYKYSKTTNEFAVITRKGVVVTYFKPSGGISYYKKIKGGK